MHDDGLACMKVTYVFTRRLLENYCFVLLTNRAPPQISDDRPDMRQRALFVTSRAVWRWNKMPEDSRQLDTGTLAITQSNIGIETAALPPFHLRISRPPFAKMFIFLSTILQASFGVIAILYQKKKRQLLSRDGAKFTESGTKRIFRTTAVDE